MSRLLTQDANDPDMRELIDDIVDVSGGLVRVAIFSCLTATRLAKRMEQARDTTTNDDRIDCHMIYTFIELVKNNDIDSYCIFCDSPFKSEDAPYGVIVARPEFAALQSRERLPFGFVCGVCVRCWATRESTINKDVRDQLRTINLHNIVIASEVSQAGRA